MGLYSYTYQLAWLSQQRVTCDVLKNPENGAKDWLDLLKSGGSKTPLESAMIIGADISTGQTTPRYHPIPFDTVDQIIAYSAELGDCNSAKEGLHSSLAFLLFNSTQPQWP